MKTHRLFLAAAVFAVASLAQAAPPAGLPASPGAPLQCLLHFSSALPGETRFGDDGSLTLAWEDNLGRRSQARIAADGGVVLTLADGRQQRYPAQPRVPTAEELARLDRIVAAYWEQGVDLVGRRLLTPRESDIRPASESEKVWDNAQGIWILVDACEKAERQARDACGYDCASEGMQSTYRAGQCGAGSSCTCFYRVSTDPPF